MTSLHSITHGQIDGDGPNFILPLCGLTCYEYAHQGYIYLNVQCIYLKTLRNIIYIYIYIYTVYVYDSFEW